MRRRSPKKNHLKLDVGPWCPRLYVFPSSLPLPQFAVAGSSLSLSLSHTHTHTDSELVIAMAISLVTVLRSLFAVLGCVMVLTLVYAIYTDGHPFRVDIYTPWMTTTVLDFYINVIALAAWVSYKESNWISATLWIILLACFGSIATCGYILLQLMKLSTKESEGPIYTVLLCHSNKYGMVNKHKHSPVLIARVLFSALGFLMLGTMLYTMLTDGSPFRNEIFTPWMTALVVDFYINVAALSVWVAYKESSWITAVVWIILFICWGSITTCFYIVCQLWQLTSQAPVCLALFKSGDRIQNSVCIKDE